MPKKGAEIEGAELNEIQIQRYQKAFDYVDKKKTGEVPVSQIGNLLSVAKEEDFDQDDINEALDKMGKGNEDTLTSEEFLQFMTELNNPNNIVDAFRLFDADNNGYISIEEFKYILKMVDSPLSDKDVKEIFDTFDVSRDGKIDYKEFVAFWNSQ